MPGQHRNNDSTMVVHIFKEKQNLLSPNNLTIENIRIL